MHVSKAAGPMQIDARCDMPSLLRFVIYFVYTPLVSFASALLHKYALLLDILHQCAISPATLIAFPFCFRRLP
jgi:hypothetical protein